MIPQWVRICLFVFKTLEEIGSSSVDLRANASPRVHPPVDMPPPAAENSGRKSISAAAVPQSKPQAPSLTRGPEQDSALQEFSETGLFSGKSFLFVGFGVEAEAQLSTLVIEHGGKVLAGRCRAVADYAVVPLLGCSVEATVDEVVTDTWLVRTKPVIFA